MPRDHGLRLAGQARGKGIKHPQAVPELEQGWATEAQDGDHRMIERPVLMRHYPLSPLILIEQHVVRPALGIQVLVFRVRVDTLRSKTEGRDLRVQAMQKRAWS